MEKQKIVERLLEEGILISPDILDQNKDIDTILKEAREKNALMLATKPKTEQPITISISQPKKLESLTVEDAVKFYSNKHEGIKKLLKDKVDAVSVVNAKKAFADASVIGMVKENIQKGFLLEDPTGEIEIVSKDKPQLGDVIGVKGFTREGKIFSNNTIYPDVPLSRKIGSVRATLTLGKENKFYVELNNNKQDIESPAWIRITGGGEIKVLFYNPNRKVTISEAKQLLMKRHLSPKGGEIIFPGDPFLIDPIPEILWIPSVENKTEIYKGVLIVCKEKEKINLQNLKPTP